MKFLKYLIILIVISCGKDSSENIDSKLLEIDSPQSNISDTENSNVELSPLDLAKSKGYSVFVCNTPSYPVKPEPNSVSNGYQYHIFGWQLDEGYKSKCVNIYEGVSGADKQLIEEVIYEATDRLGQIIPINITAVFGGVSDLNDVCKKWDALKLTNGGCFELGPPESNYFLAAAGVDAENIHNGGQGEISQAVFRDLERGKKIIYHEIFHIHQNSHKYYFEESQSFGWNEEQINSLRDSETAVPMLGPIWIEEGGAEFAAIYLSDEKGWIDYKKSMIEYLDEARSVIADAASRSDIVSLKDYEIGKVIGKLESSSNPSGAAREKAYQYSAGSIAHIFAIEGKYTTLDAILIDYYKDLAENERDYVGEGYKYSFTKNWGISLENFYKEFDEFMLKPRAEQISFLNLE